MSHEISRRDWLCRAAGTALGLGITSLDRGNLLNGAWEENQAVREPKARSVIYLYMSGGMTHVDTFDPKPENKEVQGPLEVIEGATSGMRFGQHLIKTAKQSRHLCLINSMTTTQGAHEQGDYFMHTSYEMRGTIQHPSLGSWVSRELGRRNPELPASVLINGGSRHPERGYFEMKHQPLRVDNPNEGLAHAKRPQNIEASRYDKRMELLGKFNSSYEKRHQTKAVKDYKESYDAALKLMSSRDLEAFDLSKENETLKAAYGENEFGQGCLLARRLVERGVRFAEVQLGGWDFHNDCFGRLEEKAPVLDNALGTLIEDLHQRGMLEDTMVVLATEFGRTPNINNRELGRDHFPKAFSGMIAGGGAKGGHIHGKTDKDAKNVVESAMSPMDLNATIAYAMGLDTKKVIYSPSKRPFQVAHKGKPVLELF
jgi:hypothetical protein